MVKLYIELVMTELITKVVRTAHVPDYASSRPEPNSLRHNLSQPGSNFKIGSTAKHGDFPHTTAGNEYSAYISATNEYPSPATNPRSNAELTKFEIPDFGIQKTVSTIVTLKSQKGSETYSVEELKNYE